MNYKNLSFSSLLTKSPWKCYKSQNYVYNPVPRIQEKHFDIRYVLVHDNYRAVLRLIFQTILPRKTSNYNNVILKDEGCHSKPALCPNMKGNKHSKTGCHCGVLLTHLFRTHAINVQVWTTQHSPVDLADFLHSIKADCPGPAKLTHGSIASLAELGWLVKTLNMLAELNCWCPAEF